MLNASGGRAPRCPRASSSAARPTTASVCRHASGQGGPRPGCCDNGLVTDQDGKPKARELNELIRYTMWAVFRVLEPLPDDARADIAAEVTDLFEQMAGKDVRTRGCYDVAGFRADADVMFWWIAPTSDDLQETYARLRRTRLGRVCEPSWSAMALHRPAEFNKSHI